MRRVKKQLGGVGGLGMVQAQADLKKRKAKAAAKAKNKEAAEFYTRGQVGTPKSNVERPPQSNIIEPSKEIKFGGPKKYQKGGGMGPTAGRQANYGSRNKAAEAKNKADNDLLTTVEKLTLSPGEKQKKIAERKGTGKVSVTPIQRSVARSQAARQLRDKKAKNKEAAEFYTRGQVGTPKKASGNNTNQGKASTTSGIPNVGRPLKSNSSKPAPKPAPKQTSTPAKKQAASTPPKAAPSAAPKRPTPKASSNNRPGLAKSTTKNVAEGVSTSKRANRINRRAEKVADRKSKDRMANKAARINKRAGRVEARKEKKSEVAAAKARLKAARRLQTGGLKTPSEDQKGLKKLPTAVRNKMGYKKSGGKY